MKRTLRIGGKIRLFRLQRDLTMGEASKHCGIPEKTWEHIESGAHAPSSGHLLRILKKWNISLRAVDPEDCEENA